MGRIQRQNRLGITSNDQYHALTDSPARADELVTYTDQACKEHVRDVTRGRLGRRRVMERYGAGVPVRMHACTHKQFIGDQTYNTAHAKTRYFYMTRQTL